MACAYLSTKINKFEIQNQIKTKLKSNRRLLTLISLCFNNLIKNINVRNCVFDYLTVFKDILHLST